ncbi:unnamed protein product, partial [Closterium sp. NIES-53]
DNHVTSAPSLMPASPSFPIHVHQYPYKYSDLPIHPPHVNPPSPSPPPFQLPTHPPEFFIQLPTAPLQLPAHSRDIKHHIQPTPRHRLQIPYPRFQPSSNLLPSLPTPPLPLPLTRLSSSSSSPRLLSSCTRTLEIPITASNPPPTTGLPISSPPNTHPPQLFIQLPAAPLQLPAHPRDIKHRIQSTPRHRLQILPQPCRKPVHERHEEEAIELELSRHYEVVPDPLENLHHQRVHDVFRGRREPASPEGGF